MSSKIRPIVILSLEIILFIVLTLVIAIPRLDFKLQNIFYQDGQWYLAKTQPWIWLYHYGTIPGILLAVIAVFILIFSYSLKKFVPFRRYAIFVFLTLVIGPGLLVNATFKDRWGRPRPRNVQQFDGKAEFRETWQPGIPGRGKSFPCGHCSMGFYLIVLYFLLKNKRKRLALSFLGFSLLYGIVIGVARMIQGGHFASDVLWSAAITIFTAHILYYWVLKIPDCEKRVNKCAQTDNPISKQRIAISIISSVFIASLLVWIYLFSQPVYKEYLHRPVNIPHYQVIKLTATATIGNIYLTIDKFEYPVHIKSVLYGHGFPNGKFRSKINHTVIEDTLNIKYDLTVNGHFTELESDVNVLIDGTKPVALSVETDKGNISFSNELDSVAQIITLDLNAPQGNIDKNIR